MTFGCFFVVYLLTAQTGTAIRADESQIAASLDAAFQINDFGTATVKEVASRTETDDESNKEDKTAIDREVVANADTLFRYQMAPGWCYAAAGSAMNRYYEARQAYHPDIRQCDLATENCKIQDASLSVEFTCCTGITYTGNGTGVTPRDEARIILRHSDFISEYRGDPTKQGCCLEWGMYIPRQLTPDLRHTGYDENAGKTFAQIQADIDANKPFIIANAVHFKIVYGYDAGPPQQLLVWDPYVAGGHTTITYENYFAGYKKIHYRGRRDRVA